MILKLLTANLSKKATRRTWNGRSYLVAPLTAMRELVMEGSHGPLFYPAEEIAANATDWNGVPLVLNHPTATLDDGSVVNISARSPDVLEERGLGWVFNALVQGDDAALSLEAWFDEEWTLARDKALPEVQRIVPRLERGEPIEVSTGLFTQDELAPAGATHNGVPYTHVARRYKPDHLAVLPDSKGACSIKDGCGLLVNRASLLRLAAWLVRNREALSGAWGRELRQAALNARMCWGKPCPNQPGSTGKKGGGGKKKPADAKVKAAEAKVKAVNARVEKAKASLSKAKADLKTARADLKKVKAEVKDAVKKTAKGPTKADVAAKDSASKVKAISDRYASASLAKKGLEAGSTDTAKVLGEVRAAMGKSSPHKVARELGMKRRFKNSAEAAKAVEQQVISRIGAAERVHA